MNKVLKSSTIDNRLITMLDINNMTDEDIINSSIIKNYCKSIFNDLKSILLSKKIHVNNDLSHVSKYNNMLIYSNKIVINEPFKINFEQLFKNYFINYTIFTNIDLIKISTIKLSKTIREIKIKAISDIFRIELESFDDESDYEYNDYSDDAFFNELND